MVAALPRLGDTGDEEVLELIGVCAIESEALLLTSIIDICRESATWSRVGVVVCAVAEMSAAAGRGDVLWAGHNASIEDVAL